MLAVWIGLGLQIIGTLVTLRQLEKRWWLPFREPTSITIGVVATLIVATLYVFIIAHFGLILPIVLALAFSVFGTIRMFTMIVREGSVLYTLPYTAVSSGFFILIYIWLLLL